MTVPLAAPAVDDVLGADLRCPHDPPCPPADAPDHDAAHVVFHDYGIGASLLCSGVIVFDDTGELVGTTPVVPHRPGVPHCNDTSHGHECPCVTEES